MHVRTTLRLLATALVLIAGCHDRSPAKPAAVVVDDRPTAILITTGSDGPADRDGQGFNFVHLALDDSANRAAAARHHVTDADCPVLLCLTPGGVIVSRDGGPVTADLVRRRVATAAADGPAIDGQRAALARAVPDGGPPARLRLAAFLHAHRNEWEAIPPLAAVAHDPAVDVPTRVRAWVDLVRAHQWVGEPEKGRHEAQHLLAALGPASPDAVAGANLVLGLQDATAKRFDRARAEFDAAVAAAPASAYAAEAATARVKLPRGTP